MKVAICVLALLVASAMAIPAPRQISDVTSGIEKFVQQLLPVYEHAAAGAVQTDCASLCKKAIIAKKGDSFGTKMMAAVTCPATCKAAVSKVQNMVHGTTTKAPSS